MKIISSYAKSNPYYKNNVNKIDSRYRSFQLNGPQGIMLHSVGVPQPKANVFANTWNKSNASVCPHAVLDAEGNVYQTLPWNFRGIHAGGSVNNTHIGIEMTEPNTITYEGGSRYVDRYPTMTKSHVLSTYNTAVELCADLCIKYKLDPLGKDVIISHSEGYKRGLASNHGDVEHLWDNYGLTMDQFRLDVKSKMDKNVIESKPFQVGDIVNFLGGYHYASTLALVGSKVPASKAKITSISKYSVRPYHLRAVDDKGKFISGVYGWVTASTISKIVSDLPYLVRVTADGLNVRKYPHTGSDSKVVEVIRDKGVYTIIEEQNGWGKLKSKKGWIKLSYTKKI